MASKAEFDPLATIPSVEVLSRRLTQAELLVKRLRIVLSVARRLELSGQRGTSASDLRAERRSA